jgi:alkylation response protein AidB-like acyl-CoA dehydrogenase
MELDLSDDQELLRSTAAKYIEDACPLTTVRELAKSGTGLPSDYLRRAGELGWFAMLVPEELGGGSVSGDAIRDLAAVAEERGRGLQPGPFVPMNVVADALARSGSAAQQAEILPAVVSGEAAVTWVVGDLAGAWAPGASITVAPDTDGFVLTGKAGQVQDGALAEWLLVTAGGPTGLSQFVVPTTTAGITVTPLKGHDITQRFSEVRFDSVRVDVAQLLGEIGGAAPDVERQLHLALVLSVAESIGATDVLFEMTRQYAVDRIAFGRPIGSFQSVKHQLADMSLSLEAGKAISVTATRAAQSGREDAMEIAHMAKAWVGDTGIDIAQGCFQVFGGIGYTWEHDSHLFLRRITMNNLLYGQPEWHREQICVHHGI